MTLISQAAGEKLCYCPKVRVEFYSSDVICKRLYQVLAQYLSL